ncbi:uncharacterized protein LOC128956062 [Oppia nitens]|uniref:uncharacterized protein LOC128956062 n=1 Tax=Oppia nitens TaxID=1686743 RepID=UPI0023DC0438|nr:uncharacterized protein LOC128956062 [Oppia nitens]
MVRITIQKFCSCLELWKGCVLAGIFSMATSIFDLLWSIAHMLEENNILVFYLLFTLGIQSVLFIIASGLLFVGLVKKAKWLLLPWIVLAIIDILINFLISFMELTITSRTYGSPCIIPVAGLAVTIMVCAVLLYCLLCVFAQFLIYNGKNIVNLDDTSDEPPIENNNVLSLPQVATPRDAW